ncbi:MAG: hypothetical protein ACRYFX_18970 [Janthinobacterium lividum]
MTDTLDFPALFRAIKQTQVIEFFTQMRSDLTAAQQAIQQQAGVIDQQSLVITQQQATLAALPATIAGAIGTNNTQFVTPAVQASFQAVVGGTSAQGLYTLQEIMSHLASDETGAAQLLAQQNTDRAASLAVAGRVTTVEALAASHTTTLATQTTAIQARALTSDLTTGLAGKVNTADFTPISSAFSNPTSGLAATYTLAGAAKAAADSKLPLAGGTMAAGAVVNNLGVPKAADMSKAVRRDELVGGLQQPYRFFLAVQTTPVAAFTRTNERIDIADDNGTGQVLVLTRIDITNTGTAAIAGTITITAKNVAGTVIFTQDIPVVLTSAPGVGKTLDLLSLLSTPPAEISLTEPIYFFVSASTGKYNVRLEGKKR